MILYYFSSGSVMLAMLIMLLKSFDVSFFLVDMLELFVCVECKD